MKILIFENLTNRRFVINLDNVCYFEIYSRKANPQITFNFSGHGPLVVTEEQVGAEEFQRILREIQPAMGPGKK